MILKFSDEEIYFDEFPRHSKPNQKVFLSHLLNVNLMRLMHSDSVPPDLYTSVVLGAQLQLIFFRNGTIDINRLRPRLHLLAFREPHTIQLNDKSVLNVVALGSENSCSPHIMFILQQGEDLPHLYTGISSNLHDCLFHQCVVAMISKGVHSVFVDLKRAAEVHDSKSLNKTVEKIDKILESKCKEKGKVQVIIPLLGYETFVAQLADEIRNSVFLDNMLGSNVLSKNSHLAKDSKSAKIIVKSREISLQEIKSAYHKKNLITIKIVDRAPTTHNVNEFGYCELYWSPLPNPVDLKRLMCMIEPRRIVPIVHKNMVPPQVPNYLLRLCAPEMHINEKSESMNNSSAVPNKFIPAFQIHKENLQYLDDEETENSHDFSY